MPPRPLFTRSLEIVGLYTVAVSGPLLRQLAGEPVFFTSRQATRGSLIVFALVVALVPPLVLVLVELVAGLRSRVAALWLHRLFVAGFALLAVAQVAVSLPAVAALVLAIAAGLAFGVVWSRSRLLHRLLPWLAPLAVVAVVLFVVSGAAARNVAGTQATPVVMVVFDEFTGTSLLDGRNQIDPRLYPSFARLAHDGTYYRNFTAATDETTRAMAGLMTGDLWHEHAKPTASAYPRNLFTLLGGSYRMRVAEEASDFCPPAICKRGPRTGFGLLRSAGLVFAHRVLPGGLASGLTPLSRIVTGDYDPVRAAAQVTDDSRVHKAPVVLRELGAGGRPSRFRHWLDRIDGDVGRTLYFKHVLLPHVPWQYLPDGRIYRGRQDWIPGMSDPPAFGDRWFLIQDYQRHLIQLQFTDRLLGELVERLKKLGIYDKALIVVTADNGESFLHANRDRHIADAVTFTDIASTPLLIKLPHQKRGGYSDRHVRTFDVVPTIADALGLGMPGPLLGRSLLDPRARIPDRVNVRREQLKQGNTYSISLAGYDRARAAALRRKLALFGGGLWNPGPARSLLGRPVRTSATATGLRAAVNPRLLRLLARVRPNARLVPANVTGVLTGQAARRSVPLALELNGRVAATGWSARLKGDHHVYFSFLAKPTFLRTGANRMSLLRIGAGGRLERIRMRSH